MSVQKVILPGLLFGILCVIFLTSQLNGASGKVNAVAMGAAQAAGQPVIGCTISAAYPDSIRQWCALIEQYAGENGLDPNLISAVMLQESGGQPDAYSKSGAVGLLQVMPSDGKASSFACANGPCFSTRPSMQELFDPDFNISYGTRMLADLIQRYGNIRDALKAYGPKDVGYYYADLVIGIYNSRR